MSRLNNYRKTISEFLKDAESQKSEAEKFQEKYGLDQQSLIRDCEQYIEGVNDCIEAFASIFPELFAEDELLGYGNSIKEKRKNLVKTAFNLNNIESKLDEMIKSADELAKKSAEVGNEADEQFGSGGASALRMFKIVLRGFEE